MDVTDMKMLKDFTCFEDKMTVNYKTEQRTVWKDNSKFYILDLQQICMGFKKNGTLCGAILHSLNKELQKHGYCNRHIDQKSNE